MSDAPLVCICEEPANNDGVCEQCGGTIGALDSGASEAPTPATPPFIRTTPAFRAFATGAARVTSAPLGEGTPANSAPAGSFRPETEAADATKASEEAPSDTSATESDPADGWGGGARNARGDNPAPPVESTLDPGELAGLEGLVIGLLGFRRAGKTWFLNRLKHCYAGMDADELQTADADERVWHCSIPAAEPGSEVGGTPFPVRHTFTLVGGGEQFHIIDIPGEALDRAVATRFRGGLDVTTALKRCDALVIMIPAHEALSAHHASDPERQAVLQWIDGRREGRPPAEIWKFLEPAVAEMRQWGLTGRTGDPPKAYASADPELKAALDVWIAEGAEDGPLELAHRFNAPIDTVDVRQRLKSLRAQQRRLDTKLKRAARDGTSAPSDEVALRTVVEEIADARTDLIDRESWALSRAELDLLAFVRNITGLLNMISLQRRKPPVDPGALGQDEWDAEFARVRANRQPVMLLLSQLDVALSPWELIEERRRRQPDLTHLDEVDSDPLMALRHDNPVLATALFNSFHILRTECVTAFWNHPGGLAINYKLPHTGIRAVIEWFRWADSMQRAFAPKPGASRWERFKRRFGSIVHPPFVRRLELSFARRLRRTYQRSALRRAPAKSGGGA